MSSGGFRLKDVFPVAPCGGPVAAGAGLQASVQDADQAAGQSSQGVVMLARPGPGLRQPPRDQVVCADCEIEGGCCRQDRARLAARERGGLVGLPPDLQFRTSG